MAIDIVSIPSMSAESERVSPAPIVQSHGSVSLGAEVVEQSDCIKSWMSLLVLDGRNIAREVVEEVFRTSDESSSKFLSEMEALAT